MFLCKYPVFLTGVQNNNGQQVFDCVPANGVIPPGSHVDIVVTFAPDHPSDFYSDGVRIDLFGQEEQHVFQVESWPLSLHLVPRVFVIVVLSC